MVALAAAVKTGSKLLGASMPAIDKGIKTLDQAGKLHGAIRELAKPIEPSKEETERVLI